MQILGDSNLWSRQGEPILLDQCWSSLKEAPRRPPWDFSRKCREKNFLHFLDKKQAQNWNPSRFLETNSPQPFHPREKRLPWKGPAHDLHPWLTGRGRNKQKLSRNIFLNFDCSFSDCGDWFHFSIIHPPVPTVVLCSQVCGQASVLRRRRRSCLLYLLICSLIDTCNLTSLSYYPAQLGK